ncbi:MAG: response regulator [Chloroflexota bacterium]
MTSNLSGARILYIEDDANNRELVKTALEPFDVVLEFDPWAFPEVAPTKVLRFRPDLILLDLMFPIGTSGFDVYDKLMSYERFTSIPFIVVSASDPDHNMAEARKRGMQGYIAKPLNVMTFPKHVSSVLDGQQIWIGH